MKPIPARAIAVEVAALNAALLRYAVGARLVAVIAEDGMVSALEMDEDFFTRMRVAPTHAGELYAACGVDPEPRESILD